MSSSNLPGRRRASSIMSGRFVAPKTMTPSLFSIPSISVRNVAITRDCTTSSPPERLLLHTRASISSRKTTAGVAALARANNDRMMNYVAPSTQDYFGLSHIGGKHLRSSQCPKRGMGLRSQGTSECCLCTTWRPVQ